MKTSLFLFSFFLFYFAVFSQPKGALQQTIDQLGLYYSANPSEKIIIQTDKDFYQPGENIWFSCWYWNADKSQSLPAQNEMEVRLLSSDGKIILSDKYRVEQRVTGGDFLLPGNLEAGNYFIVALLPNQKNVENSYFRKIEIRPYYQNTLLISAMQKEAFLRKGIDNEITIQAKSLTKGAAKNEKLEYTISSGEQTIETGKIKTDEAGNAVIRFRLPENENGMPFVLSVFDGKKESVETVRLASETDQLNITFYPEGGTIIPEISSKVGFYVTDKQGNPVHIEGEIRDSQNQLIYPVKTFRKGFGFCLLKAVRNERYFLHVTKGAGKDRQFELPRVNATGSSLSVLKTDAEFIWVNLTFADQSAHKISVMASQGAEAYWAADLQINGTGLLKVPVAELPQGIVLLSSFSSEGFPLNQRLIAVPNNAGMKIEILTVPESLAKKDEINLQVKFTDEKGQPLPGVARFSVSDVVCIDKQRMALPPEFVCNTILKNKIIPEESGFLNDNMQRSIDYLLIANEIQNFDWSHISGFKVGKPTQKLIASGRQLSFPEEFEARLKEKIKSFNQVKPVSDGSVIPEQYFVANSGLISKKPRRNTGDIPQNDSYKKFLETSTNLLEVIKMIKPFDMEGNKIIFPGGKNSINAQGGALIVVDGQQMGEDASVLNGINPHDIEEINVSTQPMDIQRYTGLNSVGLIEITTKRGTMTGPAKEKTPDAIQYDGDYRISRDFGISEKTDLRTTAWWNGQLFIGETGKMSLKIPSTNVVSDFVITVEGLGSNGQFGYAEKTIKVTE